MELSDGLEDAFARYDPQSAKSDTALIRDLLISGVRFLENETGWFLRPKTTRTFYSRGGHRSIFLPQSGEVTEVAIRYGSTWSVESPSSYTVVGDSEDERELIRVNGDPWPGIRPSFLRTPGLGYGFTLGSYSTFGKSVRVKFVTGFDEESDWPQDLLGLLKRLVATEYRNRPLARPRSVTEEGESFQSRMTPVDWKIIKYYKSRGRDLRAA